MAPKYRRRSGVEFYVTHTLGDQVEENTKQRRNQKNMVSWNSFSESISEGQHL